MLESRAEANCITVDQVDHLVDEVVEFPRPSLEYPQPLPLDQNQILEQCGFLLPKGATSCSFCGAGSISPSHLRAMILIAGIVIVTLVVAMLL